jgi:Virulence-associated protein E
MTPTDNNGAANIDPALKAELSVMVTRDRLWLVHTEAEAHRLQRAGFSAIAFEVLDKRQLRGVTHVIAVQQSGRDEAAFGIQVKDELTHLRYKGELICGTLPDPWWTLEDLDHETAGDNDRFGAVILECMNYGVPKRLTGHKVAAKNGQPAQSTPRLEDKPKREGWQRELLLTKNDLALETLGNVTLALQHLEPWASACWYDVVRDLRMVGDHELDDTQVTQASLDLETRIVMPIRSKHLVATALTYLCHQCERDLLREWLEQLPAWDGTRRLASWLTTYAHAEAGAYAADISRLVPVSMVARALDPGCQYRFVVILEGPENAGKTKLVRALATPAWYRELSHGLDGKEAHMRLKRAWVAELAELSSLSKTEEARLKSFFTMHEDVYIPKFSNFEVVHQRRTVFIGTVNPEGENTYLRGQTGNTRYLPIAVRDINVEGFEQVRPQVFAEALQYYHEHPADWWQLSGDGAHAAAEAREERRERSVYEDALGTWLEKTGRTVTHWEEIAEDYLRLPKDRWAERRVQMEVSKALKALGWWKGKRERVGDAGLVWPWRPGDDWHPEP